MNPLIKIIAAALIAGSLVGCATKIHEKSAPCKRTPAIVSSFAENDYCGADRPVNSGGVEAIFADIMEQQ